MARVNTIRADGKCCAAFCDDDDGEASRRSVDAESSTTFNLTEKRARMAQHTKHFYNVIPFSRPLATVPGEGSDVKKQVRWYDNQGVGFNKVS